MRFVPVPLRFSSFQTQLLFAPGGVRCSAVFYVFHNAGFGDTVLTSDLDTEYLARAHEARGELGGDAESPSQIGEAHCIGVVCEDICSYSYSYHLLTEIRKKQGDFFTLL